MPVPPPFSAWTPISPRLRGVSISLLLKASCCFLRVLQTHGSGGLGPLPAAGCLSDGVEPSLLQSVLNHTCSVWTPRAFRRGPSCWARPQAWMAPSLTQTLTLLLRKWRRLRIRSFDQAPKDPSVPGTFSDCSHIAPSPSHGCSLLTSLLHQ